MTEETNKPDIAVALQYDGKNAPRVTAKGEDEIAEEIRRIAEENDIPLHEDAILTQILSQIELGEEIPRALYVTVAEVIAFSYLMAGKVCAIPEYQSAEYQSGKDQRQRDSNYQDSSGQDCSNRSTDQSNNSVELLPPDTPPDDIF